MSLCIRIRFALKLECPGEWLGSLLVERLADNRVVLRWCHRSVALVASRRYRREIDDIKAGHRDISSLFLDVWLNGKLPPPPPTTTLRTVASPSVVGPAEPTTTAVQLSGRTESLFTVSPLTADRHIAAQPLLLSDTTYNLRRLSELWYQLLNAGKSSTITVICKTHS